MAGIIQKGARRFTTQIGAAGVPDAVTTTIPLVSVTGLPTDTQIEIIIDRTDASGNLTPAKEEVVRGTVSATDLINCTRGVEGTPQAHSAGATVNALLTASMWNNIIEYIRDLPSRGLINGKIVPTVASNNLTLAIKTLTDTDPTPNNPVEIYIGGIKRSITSALSVTANAGTNWFRAGSSETAGLAVPYFVFCGYNTTDGITLGFDKIGDGTKFSDFVTAGGNEDNEQYCRISNITNATASDVYTNVGYFEAVLSAGAGHNWSAVANVKSEPTYMSNRMSWQPTYGATGSMTYTSVTTTEAFYRVLPGKRFSIQLFTQGTTGGTASQNLTATLPFQGGAGARQRFTMISQDDTLAGVASCSVSSNVLSVSNYPNGSGGAANFGLGTNRRIMGNATIEIR